MQAAVISHNIDEQVDDLLGENSGLDNLREDAATLSKNIDEQVA